MNRREQLLRRISIDPEVCFGRPCIRGTRIWVSPIVDNLAEGISEAELLAAYPQLQTEDIRAALAYAAEMTRERIIPIPVGSVKGKLWIVEPGRIREHIPEPPDEEQP
jgi:uncharacterized protein (DUF433 family)